MDWIKAHYDRVALIAAGLFLFISAISISWNAIQFANRLIAQQAPSPKNASPPATAIELDHAAEQLLHPAQWKSSRRSGLFVPERHFIAANGLPATLQNTQVHPPVPNDWFEQYALPVEDADALDQDPDGDGFTKLDVSELLLEHEDTKAELTLVKEKVATSPQSVATFVYTWGGRREFEVRKDQEFSLKPLEEIKYKVTDVQPTKAVIVNTQKPNEPIEIGLATP